MVERSSLLVVALLGATAFADGVITRGGHDVIATRDRLDETCDDDCATLRLRVLSGLSFVSVTAIGGVRAGGLTIDGVSARYPLGTFHAVSLGATYVPGQATTRLRFTFANVEALFSCRDPSGDLHPPISGQMFYRCVPGSRLGVGAMLGDVTWDPVIHRHTVTWGRLAGVVNLLGATNSMAYVRGHLDVSLGVDAESIWHGTRDARMGSDHVSRAVVALVGLWRSPSARWELDLDVDARPALVGTAPALRDVGVLGEASALYHFLLAGPNAAISAGLDVRVDYWSDPAMALGSIDVSTRNTSLFAGVLLEVRRESPR